MGKKRKGKNEKRSVSSSDVKRPATNGNTIKRVNFVAASDPSSNKTQRDNHADIATDFNSKSLLQDVNEENEFIKWQINSIPPHIYFNNETMATVREKKHCVLDEKLKGKAT